MIASDTIVAISSAIGPAPRIIVRLSGTEALQIASELDPDLPATGGVANRTTLAFTNLRVPAWVYTFRAPHSYTAEDLVELHIPGNPLLARMLLGELTARGARQAEAGEFTARAYFAGRIDLTEAEGVAATIAAHGEQELRAARQLLGGELSRQLTPIMEKLAETLALIEAGIDFSDEDVTFLSPAQVRERISQLDRSLRDLIDGSVRFERLAHEPTLALFGRPNAGKSTLLNALAGRARAVVSNIAGTTRDVLSAEVKLRRGIVRILDAAGLGDEAMNNIDHQMKDRAQRAIESADFVVVVQDATDTRPPLAASRTTDVVVLSKSDLCADPQRGHGLPVSAITGIGMEQLRDHLDQLAFGCETAGSTLALNARHLDALADARDSLARASESLDAGVELIARDLREALDSLGQVLGQITPDDLLGRVFSTFCIGK